MSPAIRDVRAPRVDTAEVTGWHIASPWPPRDNALPQRWRTACVRSPRG